MKHNTKAIRFLTTALLSVLLVFLAATLLSCDGLNDTSYRKDPDYVEVTSLHIADANIRMSSRGEPSTFQLEVTTMPLNATNKQVTYYIPSEYHQYVTVSNTGLLTAHAVTEDIVVPVTVKSTTNSKAVLQATVIVEDVQVDSVAFNQDEIHLLYNGEPAQLSLTYKPAHGIDGRTPYFSSLDETIATVDENGLVRPVRAGRTTIRVLCPYGNAAPEGNRNDKNIKVQGFISVIVSYVEGQYQLNVSGNPNYNQVIGDFSPIDFTLNILGNNVDPDPEEIQWFVNGQRDSSADKYMQYTNTPSGITQMTYTVDVVITPHSSADEKYSYTLHSHPISIYNAFTGFDLVYDNLSDADLQYRYGDVATFSLRDGDATGTVSKYRWYLSEANDSANSVLVAETIPSARDLTRRINVAGNYTLTVKSFNDSDNVQAQSQTMFSFSSEKFLEGDTLIIDTKLKEGGLPPDSYHWYIVPCSDDGTYDERQKTLFADTPHGETVYVPLNAGTFRLLVTASINGVEATVSVHGEQQAYTYVGDVIKVYPLSYRDTARENDLINIEDPAQNEYGVTYHSAVNSLAIEGIGRSSKQVLLKWNQVPGNTVYVVELIKDDGSVCLIDSLENTEAVFGSNYCYLPTSIVTLTDVFSVRIKMKNGFYSRFYHYGMPNAKGVADETHILTFDENLYPFFTTIGYNNTRLEYTTANEVVMNKPALNGYITDATDLKELLTFLLLHKPSANTTISRSTVILEDKAYDAYALDVYFAFADDTSIQKAYPYTLSDEEAERYEGFESYARMILGVIESLPYGFDGILSFSSADVGMRFALNFPVETVSPDLKETQNQERLRPSLPDSYDLLSGDTITDEMLNALPIGRRESVYVYDSDQLVNAIVNGYNPTPQDQSGNLSTLYRIIRRTAARIASREMSDEEILLALYDYLAINVTYEPNIEDIKGKSVSKKDLYLYTAYRLEGVFTNYYTAGDVGIAKAYAALAGVFGIPCEIVTAQVGGELYTLNKVYVSGQYYLVDVSRGMYECDGYAVSSRNCFLLDEASYAALFRGTVTFFGSGREPTDNLAINPPKVSDKGDLEDVLTSIKALGAGVRGVEIDFDHSNYSVEYQVQDLLSEIRMQGVELSETVTKTYETNRIFRAIILVRVLD